MDVSAGLFNCFGIEVGISGANFGASAGQTVSLGMGNGVPGCGPAAESSPMIVSAPLLITLAGVVGRVPFFNERPENLSMVWGMLVMPERLLGRLNAGEPPSSIFIEVLSKDAWPDDSNRHWLLYGS